MWGKSHVDRILSKLFLLKYQNVKNKVKQERKQVLPQKRTTNKHIDVTNSSRVHI